MAEQLITVLGQAQEFAPKLTGLKTQYQAKKNNSEALSTTITLSYMIECNKVALQLFNLIQQNKQIHDAVDAIYNQNYANNDQKKVTKPLLDFWTNTKNEIKVIRDPYERAIALTQYLHKDTILEKIATDYKTAGTYERNYGFHLALWGGIIGCALFGLSFLIGSYIGLVPICAIISLVVCAYGVKRYINSGPLLKNSEDLDNVLQGSRELNNNFCADEQGNQADKNHPASSKTKLSGHHTNDLRLRFFKEPNALIEEVRQFQPKAP